MGLLGGMRQSLNFFPILLGRICPSTVNGRIVGVMPNNFRPALLTLGTVDSSQIFGVLSAVCHKLVNWLC